jgi:predicted metal-dependent hydrolase
MDSAIAVPDTADKLPVYQRDIHFDISKTDMHGWHPAGPHVTQLLNALSLFFPEGEKFFIDSVRRYRNRITDPQLLADVKGFIGQEAMHGREHRAFNTALANAGYPAAELEAKAVRILELARKLMPPRVQLAATIALEHFTAILAEVLLSDESVLKDAPPEMAALWRWHAIEETEHKAVAYDVYRQVAGTGVRAYFLRCSIMLSATVRFLWQSTYTQYRLVKHAGRQGDWAGWRALFRFLLVKPGFLRRIALPWLSYFRPGFHPWQHDNRHYVVQWKAVYENRLQDPLPPAVNA